MPRAETCVWTPGLLSILAAVLVLSGCPRDRGNVVEEMDTAYLAVIPARESLTFTVYFFAYDTQEAYIVEDAWGVARGPRGDIDELWRQNGLRTASADRSEARRVWSIINRANTLKKPARKLTVLAGDSVNIPVGVVLPSAGLVYTTAQRTFYREKQNLKLSLKVAVLGEGQEARVSVTPLFTSGADVPKTTSLEDLQATYPLSQAELVMIGPARKPRDRSLGELLYREDDAARMGSLIIVEARIGR